MNIDHEDDSSKEFSQNDSLSRALGKEHSGRVRGVGSGPCPTQVFGQTAHQLGGLSVNAPVDHIIQTEMNDMKSQLEAERLKVQNLELVVEAERLRRQAFEDAVKYILQMQGDNLPPHLAAMINVVVCILNFKVILYYFKFYVLYKIMYVMLMKNAYNLFFISIFRLQMKGVGQFHRV